MNFNYTNLTNKELQRAIMENKGEKLKKGKEEEPVAEEPKPVVVDPKGEEMMEAGATAMENYAKGMMLQGPRSGDGTLKTMITGGDEPPAPNTVDPGAGVEPPESPEPALPLELTDLITDWEQTNKTLDCTEKMRLLTKIIDIYANELHDEEGARIWRARRYTVNIESIISTRLAFLQEHPNGGYNLSDMPPYSTYDGYQDDNQALHYLYTHLSSIDDNEKVVCQEYLVTTYTESCLCHIIRSKADDCSNPDGEKKQARSYANSASNIMNLIVTNPLNANELWHDTFVNACRPKLDKLKNTIDEIEFSDLQNMINDLQEIIETLRNQGFPYCDLLLIEIQGYISYAGYDELNVLPETLS